MHKIALRSRFQAPHIKLRFTRAKPPPFSVSVSRLPEHLNNRGWQEVEHRLPIVRHECINVHETVYAMWDLFRNASDDHSCIAMTHQDDVI